MKQKLSFIVIPSVVAIGLYAVIQLTPNLRSDENLAEAEIEITFNGYAEGINTVIYNDNGEIEYTLQANRQIQYNDESIVLTAPLIRLFSEGKSDWNIVANSGKITPLTHSNAQASNDIDNIEMTGNVEIYTLDKFSNRMLITTDLLNIDPNAETMHTNSAVALEMENHHQTGVGMLAELKEDRITFNQNVVGSYAPASQ